MCLRRILRSTIDLPCPSRIGWLLGYWQESRGGDGSSNSTPGSASNPTPQSGGVYCTPSRAMSTSKDTIKSFSTPSFGAVSPSHGAVTEEELGNVSLQPLSSSETVTHRDLHGPWVIVIPPELGIPSGELMMELDGHVTYRPGSELGGGIGTFTIQSAVGGKPASVLIRLECYVYAQKGPMPPSEAVSLTIHGLLQHAVITSHNQKILTLHGRAERGVCHGASRSSSNSITGMVQAAKMDGWSPETQKVKPWIPNATIQRDLATLLPPLKTLSHQTQPRLNRIRHRVGAELLDAVYYAPEWITADTEREILQLIRHTPDVAKSKLKKRLAQEWGCTMCEECNLSFVSDVNLPPWCNQLCDQMLVNDVFSPSYYPNSVRVHEYGVGDGIAPHVDGPIYVPIVAILSLGAPCLFSFYPRREPYENPMEHYDDTFRFDGEIAKQRPLCSVLLEPRSLMIFERDAYWYHPHGVSDQATDSLLEERSGPIINWGQVTTIARDTVELPRAYRVGVTVRHLLPRCDHQINRQEYFMKRAWKLSSEEALSAFDEVDGKEYERREVLAKGGKKQSPSTSLRGGSNNTPHGVVGVSSPSPSVRVPQREAISFPEIRGESAMKPQEKEQESSNHREVVGTSSQSSSMQRPTTPHTGSPQRKQPETTMPISPSRDAHHPTMPPLCHYTQGEKNPSSVEPSSGYAPTCTQPPMRDVWYPYPPPYYVAYPPVPGGSPVGGLGTGPGVVWGVPPMMFAHPHPPCFAPYPSWYPVPHAIERDGTRSCDGKTRCMSPEQPLGKVQEQGKLTNAESIHRQQHSTVTPLAGQQHTGTPRGQEADSAEAPVGSLLLQEVNEKLEAARRTLDTVVRVQGELQQTMHTLVVAIASAQEQSGSSLDAVSRAVVRMDSALHKLAKSSADEKK